MLIFAVNSMMDTCKVIDTVIKKNDADFPFTAVYLLKHPNEHIHDRNPLILHHTTGLPSETSLPPTIPIPDVELPKDIPQRNFMDTVAKVSVMGISQALCVTDMNLGPCGHWRELPSDCLISPIIFQESKPIGIFVAGINTRYE